MRVGVRGTLFQPPNCTHLKTRFMQFCNCRNEICRCDGLGHSETRSMANPHTTADSKEFVKINLI